MIAQLTHASFLVHGMTCASCVNRVERALKTIPGVTQVSVNLATQTASIDFDSTMTTSESLTQAVQEAGYEIPIQSQTIIIGGMTCASCVSHVERALQHIPGVLSAHVNLATQTGTISTWTQQVTLTDLQQTITDAGYTIIHNGGRDSSTAFVTTLSQEKETRQLLSHAIFSGIAGFLVMLGTMNLLPGFSSLSLSIRHTVLFALTSFILVWAGGSIYTAAWKAARHKSMNMNTLIAIGTIAAFGYSTLATFFPSTFEMSGIPAAIYYDTAILIISFILFGRYLESRAKHHTSSALHRLMSLRPKTARIRRGQDEVDIPIEAVERGNLVIVRPGEQIPVDGIVIEGQSAVNEAMLTGESLPTSKEPGATVFTGTLNTTGSFLLEASAVGKDTMLAHIVQLVQEAQGSKPPIQRIADYIASIFVPSVLGIATLAFLLWWNFGPDPSLTYAILTFVAVLIIACPCALGLATPTAIMVGTGRGAEQGILIRHAEALETVHHIDTVVFDKTGTVTQGIPKVTDIIVSTWKQKELLRLAASLERRSEHPLAQAIVQHAIDQSLALEEAQRFMSTPGQGVKGEIAGQSLLIGNETFIKNNLGISNLNTVSDSMQSLAQTGKTPILVTINGQIEGIIGIADVLRPESQEAIQQLTKAGLDVVMLTGDHHQVAQAIASEVGITKFFSEILPDQKAAEIRKLQQQGKKVAMVGDGINDAPALAQADIGIAIGTGTDVAMETAQITLMNSDMRNVQTAIQLSRATMRTIHQNLGWAFGYNLLLIPLAAGILYPIFQGIGGVPPELHWLFGEYGFLQPILAAAAMALSSVSVVTNSLRLQSIELK